MPRKSNLHLLLKSMIAAENITKSSGTCGMCDEYKSVLLHDKTAVDCFPACIECLMKTVGELRSD